MNDKIDFIKGHCGWDILTLVIGEQVPVGREYETALKIVDAPVNGGIEVGLMYPPDEKGDIPVKILNAAERDWIPMCGGMTQVIGKAVVETFLKDYYKIVPVENRVTIQLRTDSSCIPIKVDVKNNQATKVTTVMDDYIAYLNPSKVEQFSVQNVPVAKVGYFIIINIDALTEQFAGIDFTQRSPGKHWEILDEIYLICKQKQKDDDELYIMLYDMHPEGEGQARFFPRFYHENPWEFQCGTGTIATGIGMAAMGDLPFKGDKGTVLVEWGSHKATPDPYGIRTSEINLGLKDGHVCSASFSHNIIEILSEGKLTIPKY